MICKVFFVSKTYRKKALGLGLLLLIFLAVNLYANFRLSLLARDVGAFWAQKKHTHQGLYSLLVIACWIRFGYVVTDPLDQFFSRHFGLLWRKAISDHLVEIWSSRKDMTQYRHSSEIIQNAVYKCTQFLEDMGTQIIRSLVILTFYLPNLWILSPLLKIRSPWVLNIPGILAIVVTTCAIVGGSISYWIGRQLVHLGKENQINETNLRSKLELVEHGAHHYDKARIDSAFSLVYTNYAKTWVRYLPFKLWDSLYYHVMVIVPLGMVGIWYIDGIITFGALGQILFVFNETSLNLMTITNSWSRIMDFLATRRRLSEYLYKLQQDDGHAQFLTVASIKKPSKTKLRIVD